MSVIQADTYADSTALTITLASLASTTADPPVGRESSYIDQSADLGLDALLDGKITTGTSPTASRQIQIWGWGSAYDGTTHRYPGGVTGSNAGLTPGAYWRNVLWPILVIDTSNVSDTTYTFAGIPFFRAYRGLMLPIRYGVFVFHSTGVALNSTAGNHEIRITNGKQAVV